MSVVDTGQPQPVEQTRLLLGEGVEEKLFFKAFLDHLAIHGVQVEQYEGKNKLEPYLKALVKRSGFERVEKVAIVRDADEDPAGAETSVRNSIESAGFPAKVNVTILIVPGGDRRGALEDLCLRTIEGEPIERCIEDYMDCAGRATGAPHASIGNRAKARIHAWLAAQLEPDLRLGIAAQKGWLNWQAEAFAELARFLQELQ